MCMSWLLLTLILSMHGSTMKLLSNVFTRGTQLQLLVFSLAYIPQYVYNKTYDWWDTDL